MSKQRDPAQEKWKAMAAEMRARAALLSHGPERDALLKEARRLETASHMDDWASSPGLRPPKA